MIVNEGNQIGFSFLSLVFDHWSVHAIGLPQVVGKLCLETSAVFRQGAGEFHEVLLMEKTIHRRRGEFDARRHQSACVHLGYETDDGGAGQLSSYEDESKPGLLVDGSGFSLITASSAGESFEFTA